jgi:hypothetical protein
VPRGTNAKVWMKYGVLATCANANMWRIVWFSKVCTIAELCRTLPRCPTLLLSLDSYATPLSEQVLEL